MTFKPLKTLTEADIEALTMADVETAKAEFAADFPHRNGVSTVTYTLSQVGNTRTLDEAKRHLKAERAKMKD